jgi:hypothetical protein
LKSVQDRVIDFLLRHKEFAKIAISKSYPFRREELIRYTDSLAWNWIADNNNILWTEKLFYEFEKKINVVMLSDNTNFPWTEQFIDKYLYELFYDLDSEEVVKSAFAKNPTLPWSEEFIEKYAEHWQWMWLSMNEAIPFTTDLLDKYMDRWVCSELEYNQRIAKDQSLRAYLNISYDLDVRIPIHNCEFCFKGEDLFEEYKGKSLSVEFCFCPNFNWTDSFSAQLRKRIYRHKAAEYLCSRISWQTFDHWSIDILEGFEEFLNFDPLRCISNVPDYLAKHLKDSGKLDELIKQL